MRTAKLLSIGAILVAVCLAGGIAGCQNSDKDVDTGDKQGVAQCPSCGMKMDAGAYCAKCNAVAAAEGTVRCEMCKKDFKAGEFCEKCNKYMLEGDATCATCGAKGPAGSLCAKCNTYIGVDGAAYCPKCKKPIDKATGCPTCNKADVEGPML